MSYKKELLKDILSVEGRLSSGYHEYVTITSRYRVVPTLYSIYQIGFELTVKPDQRLSTYLKLNFGEYKQQEDGLHPSDQPNDDYQAKESYLGMIIGGSFKF